MAFEEKVLETKEVKYLFSNKDKSNPLNCGTFIKALDKMIEENEIKYLVVSPKCRLFLWFAFSKFKKNIVIKDTKTFLAGTYLDIPLYISPELESTFIGFGGRKPTQNQLNDLSKIEDRIIAVGKVEL